MNILWANSQHNPQHTLSAERLIESRISVLARNWNCKMLWSKNKSLAYTKCVRASQLLYILFGKQYIVSCWMVRAMRQRAIRPSVWHTIANRFRKLQLKNIWNNRLTNGYKWISSFRVYVCVNFVYFKWQQRKSTHSWWWRVGWTWKGNINYHLLNEINNANSRHKRWKPVDLDACIIWVAACILTHSLTFTVPYDVAYRILIVEASQSFEFYCNKTILWVFIVQYFFLCRVVSIVVVLRFEFHLLLEKVAKFFCGFLYSFPWTLFTLLHTIEFNFLTIRIVFRNAITSE